MVFPNRISSGNNPPEDINVVIEISKGSNIKYELNSTDGFLYVDRILSVEMVYPLNYGFIPRTIENSEIDILNKDSLDVFVIGADPFYPKSVINCIPIGVIFTKDQDGIDSKIIVKPSSKSYQTIPSELIFEDFDQGLDLPIFKKLIHFIEHHKDFEENKFVKINEIGNKEKAKSVILKGIKNYELKGHFK